MNLTFLGSGCWQGIPAPFQDDKISKEVKWGSKDFRFRTSLLITTQKGSKILVEATPDIRLQSWKFNLSKPDAILVSHWHWDHLFGLLDIAWFSEKNKVTVYGNSTTKKWYDSRIAHVPVNFITFESYRSFEIDNLKITPLKVNHVDETDGFLFEDKDSGKKFAYLSDLYEIPLETEGLIKGTEAVITDATYLESDISDDSTHLQKNQFNQFLKKIISKEIILTGMTPVFKTLSLNVFGIVWRIIPAAF
ncbi:MAG: MBL fold metallo-hydrolase [Candidatus Staskawiczbacteria bacterium]|nr:MBL fold metallo-hydrolase [Candidatus Staskawiczbacteria bacterium]